MNDEIINMLCMGMFVMLIAAIIILCIIIKEYNKQKKNNISSEDINADKEITDFSNMPYSKKYLLTKNEWKFYKELKPIADELGYAVLAKIRVADLVDVKTENKSEWQRYFNKIKSKHIDFILAKPENLQIVLLIELDDNTHNTIQKDRDKFIEQVYLTTGYQLLRTRNADDLKNQIEYAIVKSEFDKNPCLCTQHG